MKQTNWKNVAKGTPVLFRRSKDSEYEQGTWVGGDANVGAPAGAFCWSLDYVSGDLSRRIGASITDKGEWHIDPFWCKLAKPEETQGTATISTLSREHAQALSTLVTERLSELENTKLEARTGIRYWYPKCVDDTEEGREAYNEYNRLQNLRRSTNIKLKKWRKIKFAIKAIAK